MRRWWLHGASDLLLVATKGNYGRLVCVQLAASQNPLRMPGALWSPLQTAVVLCSVPAPTLVACGRAQPEPCFALLILPLTQTLAAEDGFSCPAGGSCIACKHTPQGSRMSCAADTGVTSGFMGAFVGLGYSCTMKRVTWPVLFMGLLM